MKRIEVLSLFSLIAITLYFGGTLLSYFKIEGASFSATDWLLLISLVVAWSQIFTWKSKKEVKKDEMGNGTNYTLFIALCVAYITHPVIQFIQVKKHI
ncbi:hypothetical protein [Bacillus vallismortis]|uniref:hypothetical protein n=1 Tax=Bacillus vallismortis TaxID=72361 RepID=UPI00028933C6|nr:hypothetical protein [Bacillus vallismortis]MBG9770613.1 hypothetical protein [Bacillus vallismortis]MEC1267918.1 hypothetical protein [Bacillus vallismortis]QAV10826.1 hypothetical protein BV11031_20910 [Bacillus vallismortis]